MFRAGARGAPIGRANAVAEVWTDSLRPVDLKETEEMMIQDAEITTYENGELSTTTAFTAFVSQPG